MCARVQIIKNALLLGLGVAMSPGYVINIESEDDDENDVEIMEFRQNTRDLLKENSKPTIVKKLSEVQCPICFDEVTQATTTLCGHVFCLECIQQSISSSNARGQVRGKRGTGLCPLCRKTVAFKDTIVMKMKVQHKTGVPELPDLDRPDDITIHGHSSDDEDSLFGERSPLKSKRRHVSDDENDSNDDKKRKVE